MTSITILGIDLAKSVFQLHGMSSDGRAVLRKQVKRKDLSMIVANLPACTIAMESCGGSQYWGRMFESFGHKVRLIPAQYVKPFVKSQKNDRNDAEAICEAASRPTMHFVPLKTVSQQDMQALHRMRQGSIKTRTALANRIRGILLEYGIVIAKNLGQLRLAIGLILADAENELSVMMRDLILCLYEELKGQDEKILDYDRKIKSLFKQNERAQQISEIPGVGVMTATALVAAVGEAKVFKNGRQMSAWLGLVPKQHSSGGKTVLMGITKRGDGYLRTLLVHGARSVIVRVDKKSDPQSEWLKKLKEKKGVNKAAVALANKNARIIFAMLKRGEAYKMAS